MTSTALRAAPAAAALALGAAAGLLGAGCGHDRHRDPSSVPPGAAVLKEAEAAADAIVSATRLYVEARERTPAGAAPKDDIAAKDAALAALLEAGQADRACALAARIADDADIDPGRAARLGSSVALVRRVSAVVARTAADLARSAAPAEGLKKALETDVDHLRASLRALKVELYAIQASVDHDD
jgi:hypothetical protein